ncbi:unnamed protein product [Auanema sp. JU1783]|nr:unnamed protein product [Auanema sp. JU1783]
MHKLFLLNILIGFVCSFNFQIPYGVKPSQSAVHMVLEQFPHWISEKFSIIIQEEQHSLKSDEVLISTTAKGQTQVVASSGLAALYGINHYLRNYCFTQVTWDNSSIGNGCSDESINDIIRLEAPAVRYFGNPAAFSYSFAWWNWKDWQRMLDWLALNGFNMVYMPIGQEALWKEVFMEMALSRNDLEQYFTGPAYLAWNRMGKLKSWGGGLTDSFMDSQLELAKKIVGRMNELGIIPVLPTFSGIVPDVMESLFADETFVRNMCWQNFGEDQSCLLSVHPASPLFQEIADRFMKKQQAAYGSATHVYSADPFVDMNSLNDYRQVKLLAKAIYTGCAQNDERCIWLLHSSTFDEGGWSSKLVKTFLSAIPLGNLLMIDQTAEHHPRWVDYNSFYGHAFVWGFQHNAGGSTEIRGNLKHMDKSYQYALSSENSMIGGGLTMEAINQNFIVYQFMIDRMWRKSLAQLSSWLSSYVSSRYNSHDETMLKAWNLIAQSFYSEPMSTGDYPNFSIFLYNRPKFNQRIKYWFDPKLIGNIANYFASSKDILWQNDLFRQDYNDFMREYLQYQLGNRVILQFYEGYGIGDNDLVQSSCLDIQKMFKKINQHTNYNLLDYEKAAVSFGTTDRERKQLSENSRDILTTWGPSAQNLDSAHREWAGLISDYYQRRWAFFCEWALTHKYFNVTAFNEGIMNLVEIPFVTT